ncbi:MAG: HlyC/CorC family transporter [Pirellulaceae bacterium]|nr:HlyC/CorC family transporter [Pirellulaceae bacterium]
MSPDTVCWLAAAGLAVTASAAIAARSLATFSRRDLEEICRRRDRLDRLGVILRRHDQVGLAAETMQVIGTAVVVLAVGYWTWIESPEAQVQGDWTMVGTSVGVGALLLLAVEIWIPWAVARLWASPVVYHTWPVWRAAATLLGPLMLGARLVDTLMHRLAGRVPEVPDEESFEEEIRTIVTEGHREGLLEEDARGMIEGIIELGDLDVSEIMTPRTDMVSLSVSLSWPELLEEVIGQGHTRIPVHDKNRDDIIGVLYMKDLLAELAKGPAGSGRPWTELLREPYFVPETKPIDVLLQDFQQNRHHMAVVLDEYGGVSGLVTMEDVLEEIVGEIIDEYDIALVDGIKPIDNQAFEVLGNVHIDEINERLGLDLPDDADFDTIGGMVFSELGHVPQAGEQLQRDNVRITVVEATRRRILRVRLELLDRLATEET